MNNPKRFKESSNFIIAFTLLGLLGSIASIIALFLYLFPFKNGENHKNLNTLKKIEAKRLIKVGYIPYYEITSNEAQNGQIKGFLVDVLYEVVKDLGLSMDDVEFSETDWQSFGKGLDNGKYDLSIAGTFRTPERERQVEFTEPLFYLGNGALVQKDDDRFNSIEDLNHEGIEIAVVMGEQGYEYAQRYLERATLRIITGSDLTLACLEVERGHVDAALSDQYILWRYIKTHTKVKDAFADKPYLVLPICWAVRKGDSDFLEYINGRIKKLEESGWLRRLRANYPTIPFAQHPEISLKLSGGGQKLSFFKLLIDYFPAFSSGLINTFLISAISIFWGTILGMLLGLVLASKRNTVKIKLLRFVLKGYVYTFLAIPALVLIIILYYNNILSYLNSVAAAIIALSLNLSPFAAKIIASGINNIPEKYINAARVLGYNSKQIVFKFKIPMIKRNSLQPLLVQWFTTVKLSSLASVIGVTEALHRSQQVIRETYQTESAYIILVICYMFIVVPISITADYYDKKFNISRSQND